MKSKNQKRVEVPYAVIHEVMDNFMSASLIMSTLELIDMGEFSEENSGDTTKEKLMLEARRKLLQKEENRDVIVPFVLGAIDFLCQQYDLQYAQQYHEIFSAVASDIFSKLFGVSEEESAALVHRGFELNATERGFSNVKEGGESLLAWLKGNSEASMRLSYLLATL